jgi:hypothetical protein
MHTITKILLCSFAVVLSACQTDEYYAHEHAHESDIPELEAFNIVDSYRTNSEFEPGIPLRISPYVDNGEFELFWELEKNVRYRAELFINDTPQLENAILVTSTWCGPDQNCGQFSYQYCEYQSNLRLQCAAPERNNTVRDIDISPLFEELPDTLYLSLEVCDQDLLYCEYQSRAVEFE